MFGHKPGAGAARGAAPAPSATQTAARRWRALIGVALVAGLLAGGCAGPTPAPPPSPTPGTASTVVVEPSPTPTPTVIVEPSPTPLPAPRYERADGAIVARDAAGNPVSAVAEDVREKINREAGLIAGSGRASGLGLSCHVSASGGVMWAVTDGDEDLPAGSLLELVERKGETEIRYHTLAGATHDLNQFRDADDEAFNEKDVPESLKVIPNKLELVESNTGEFEVQVIQTTADSDGTEQDEIIGYVDEQGDWARKQIFEIGKDGKTLWIWDKGQPATNDTPRISPAMVLDQEGSELLQAHGGVRDVRELDNGLYEFTMNDGSVIGAQEKDDKLTLIAKEVEKHEFYHFEPLTDTNKISNSIIYRIAGGKDIPIENLLPRIIQMDNGASVTLSEAIYSELLSQIPKTDLENITPEELHKRISKLAGSSEWAETLKYFTNKNNANTLGRNLLNIGPTAKFFISPDGSIIDFDLLPNRNGQSTIVTVLQKKTNGNETKYLRTGPSEEHLREYYLSKRVGQVPIDILWSEKLNKLVLTDGYVATSYFDPETSSWKKVESGQMQDYKILSPEQEERYIIDQLKTKKATYNSAQYEFTDYISTSEYPQTFILVGGENGFTEEFANLIQQTLKWLLDKSPTFRKNYLESDIRFIAKPTDNPNNHLSRPTNIGTIYGYDLSTDRFFGYDITQRKVLLPLNLAHEITRVAKIKQGVPDKEHDKAVYKDQGEIVNEILPYFTKEEQKTLLSFHEGDATYMNLSP